MNLIKRGIIYIDNIMYIKNVAVWIYWTIIKSRLILRFLYSVTQTLGTIGSLAVSSIDVDTLPVLMIIMRSRSNTEIFTIVHGNVGVNELLTNLVQAVDIFQVRSTAILYTVEQYCYFLRVYIYKVYYFILKHMNI